MTRRNDWNRQENKSQYILGAIRWTSGSWSILKSGFESATFLVEATKVQASGALGVTGGMRSRSALQFLMTLWITKKYTPLEVGIWIKNMAWFYPVRLYTSMQPCHGIIDMPLRSCLRNVCGPWGHWYIWQTGSLCNIQYTQAWK